MNITFTEFDLIHTALARHVVDGAGEDGHEDLRALLQKWATWRSGITEVVQCADCRTWLQRPTCEPASDYCERCGPMPQQMDLFVGAAS